MFKFINITKLEIAQELIKELIRNSPSYHQDFQTADTNLANKKGWDFTSLSKAFNNPDIVIVPNVLARLQMNKILSSGHAISSQANIQFPKHFRSGEIKTLFKYINENKIRATSIPAQYAPRFAVSDPNLKARLEKGHEIEGQALLQAFKNHINQYPLELNETFQSSSTWAQVLAFQDILEAGDNKYLNDIYHYEKELPKLRVTLHQTYKELAYNPATTVQFGYLLEPQSTGFTDEELAQGLAAQSTLIKGGIDHAVLEPSHITEVVNQLNFFDQNSCLGTQGEVLDNPIDEPEDFDNGYMDSLLQEHGASSSAPAERQPVEQQTQNPCSDIAQAGFPFPGQFAQYDNATADTNLFHPQLQFNPERIKNLPNTEFRDPRILTTTYSRVMQVRSILTYYADYFPSFYLELENEALNFRVEKFSELNEATQKFIRKHFGEDNKETHNHEFLGKLDILHRVLRKYKLYNVTTSLQEEEFLAPRKDFMQRLRNLPATFTPPNLSETLRSIFQDKERTAQAQEAQAKNELLEIIGAKVNTDSPKDTQRAKASSIFFYAEALDFMQSCKFEVVDKSIQSNQNIFILGDKFDTQENINFYDTLAQLLGYNIYYFNQVPTFGMWKTQASLGRTELLNYRINQIYTNLIAENHELQQNGAFTAATNSSSALKDSNSELASLAGNAQVLRKSEVNNNPLTYWGQVAYKTSEVFQALKDKSCDIMHIYYDSQEMQERHQRNLQHLNDLLVTYTEHSLELNKELSQSSTPNPELEQQQAQAQLDFYAGLQKLEPLPSLLTQLQKSIYEYWDFQPNQPLYYLAANDNSLQIYQALNKKRELEFVQQQILQALNQDPTLELDDILVVSPIIKQYAPIIPQVFDQYLRDENYKPTKRSRTAVSAETVGLNAAHDSLNNYNRYLTYQILDFNREVDELLTWCKTIFKLNPETLQVYDIERLLSYSWMQEFYGLTPADLTTLIDYLKEHPTNLRFGEMSFARTTAKNEYEMGTAIVQEFGGKYVLDTGVDYNSWQQILLQLGLSNSLDFQGHTQILNTNAHSKTNSIETHDLVAKFQAFFFDIQELAQIVNQEQEFTAWFELVERLRCKYFANHPDEDENLDKFIRSYSLLIGRANSLRLRISNYVFLAQIEEELTNLKKKSEVRGRVTFASMDAINATNYKFVIAMGMGADNFPKHRKYFELDLTESLTTQSNRPSQYELDVHSFLQLLLNTGKRLLFTYEAFNAKQEELNLCQPLETLRAFLDNYCGATTFHGAETQFLAEVNQHTLGQAANSHSPIQNQLNLLLMGRSSAQDGKNLFSRRNCIIGTQQPSSKRNFLVGPALDLANLYQEFTQAKSSQEAIDTNPSDLVSSALTQLLQTPYGQAQQQSLLDLVDQDLLNQQHETPAESDSVATNEQEQAYDPSPWVAQSLDYLLPWLSQQTRGMSEWLAQHQQQHQVTTPEYFNPRYLSDACWLLEQVYGKNTEIKDLNGEIEEIEFEELPIVEHVQENYDYSDTQTISFYLDDITKFFKDPSKPFSNHNKLGNYKFNYTTHLTPTISGAKLSSKDPAKLWHNLTSSPSNISQVYNEYLNGKRVISNYSLEQEGKPKVLLEWVSNYYNSNKSIAIVKLNDKTKKNTIGEPKFVKFTSELQSYHSSLKFSVDQVRLQDIINNFNRHSTDAYWNALLEKFDPNTHADLHAQLKQLQTQVLLNSSLTVQEQFDECQKCLQRFPEITEQDIAALVTPALNLNEINILQMSNKENSSSDLDVLINLDVEFDLCYPQVERTDPNDTDIRPALYFSNATKIKRDSKGPKGQPALTADSFPLFKILAFMHTDLYRKHYNPYDSTDEACEYLDETHIFPDLVIENCYFDEDNYNDSIVVRYYVEGTKFNYLSLDSGNILNNLSYENIFDKDFLNKLFNSDYSLVGNGKKVNRQLNVGNAKILFARILSFYLIGKDLYLPLGKYNFFSELATNRNYTFSDPIIRIADMYLSCFNSYQLRLIKIEKPDLKEISDKSKLTPEYPQS